MRRRHLATALASVALLTGIVLAAPAGAATVVVDGEFDGTGPTMPVVGINQPDCIAQGVTPVEYHAYDIIEPVPGPNTITVTRGSAMASMYLYEGSFDPDNGLENCVAGANDFEDDVDTIEYEFLPDTAYIIVVFDDSLEQLGGTYQLSYEDGGADPTPPPPPPTPVVEEPGPSASGGAAPVTAAPRFTG